MASGQHKIGRFLLPVFMAMTVTTLGLLLFFPSKKKPEAAPVTPAPTTTQAPAGGTAGEQAPASAPGAMTGLRARPQPLTPGGWATIGSLAGEEKEGPLARITFDPAGAGIRALELRDHHQGTEKSSPHEMLQQTQQHDSEVLVPFALVQAEINGQRVPLAGMFRDAAGTPVASDWAQTAPGRFEALIENDSGQPVAKVTRAYTLLPGRYEITLEQSIENLTTAPISARLVQLGPVELAMGTVRYGGDARRLRYGVLHGSTATDVEGRSPVVARAELLGTAPFSNNRWAWPDYKVWPTLESTADAQRLSWIGLTNRFFGVTAHSVSSDKQLSAWESIDRVVLTRTLDSDGRPEAGAALALRATTPVQTIEPAKTGRFDLGIYAGPIDREPLRKADLTSDKGSGPIRLGHLEIYYFPGPCSFCTFQFLAYFLRWVLSIFATYVVFDWALAIILLVVCVRTVLHPITKWSQLSLQRFGKQMSRIAPKQKAIQEKFKDDPARQRQEIATLMREENVSYAGMLGCFPMLLQTPIWIALSSLMFFLFDLRHAPAFFGFFQKITGGSWHFLADLSEPDRLISFKGFTLPLMGLIDSVNILPVILGVVFYVQQKYLTPPPTATLSPEMEMQQKIMKFVIVFLFPLMMYNAPSGLALYFLTNSTLGIIESRAIRKKFEKEEAAREELLKRDPHALRRKPGEGGFFAKLQDRFAQAQHRAQELQAQRDKLKGR